MVEKLVPDPLKKFEHISESTVSTFIQFAFIVFQSRGLPLQCTTRVLTTSFYLI